MSHLATICHRVEKTVRRNHNQLLPKHVRNLREYVENWGDFNESEYEKAEKLYNDHREVLDAEEQMPFPDPGVDF